jgi:aryl-alcohol dehydrogenase-like predicted oxidoreductase
MQMGLFFSNDYIYSMEKRKIGRSDLLVSPLAFGGNVFGWTLDEKQSFEMLDAFVGAGFNFIDTADVYARWANNAGGSEKIIGNWMKARKNRNQLVIATKVGMDMGDGKIGLAKKYILQAVEDSLKRLQTDHIDLYQSHKDDEVTPVEDTLQAYQQLIKEGKVRFIGASNFSAERLQKALNASEKYKLPRYECLQPHYNLCERKLFEDKLEKVCLDNTIGVIPYFSLAAGFLTGKYRSQNDASKSVRGKGLTKYMNENGFGLLAVLDEVAEKHKTKPASVAIAWLLSRPAVTAPIASATSKVQFEDIVNGVKLKLDNNDLQKLDVVSLWTTCN